MDDKMDWVEKTEEKNKEERSKEYFNLVEGDNRFQLLTHLAPFAQVWNQGTKKYEVALEGTKRATIRGVCFVHQEGLVKLAKLPYTVVKQIRHYQNNPDWELGEFPWLHVITINAKNAGSKEVDYNLSLSPKQVPIPPEILEELAKKPTPEEMVEKMKEKGKEGATAPAATGGEDGIEYPTEDINPDDIPF